MKRLQGKVPVEKLLVLKDENRRAEATSQAALEDMNRAAAGFRTGLEPTGDAEKTHALEDYANVDDWATAVMELLSEEHKVDCTEVHLKEMDKVPCSKSCSGGCRHCVFWRAVRYWRNIETGGKVTEGYMGGSCSLARLKGNVGSQVDLK